MAEIKHHKTKDKCDFCGKWVNKYKCFFDEKSKVRCICEECDKGFAKKIVFVQPTVFEERSLNG